VYQEWDENNNDDNNNATTTLNNLKIVFILREPVSRELSWHNHLLTEASRENPAPWAIRHVTKQQVVVVADDESSSNATTTTTTTVFKTFEEYMHDAILPSLENGTNRGLYAHWLQRWVDAGFSRRQMFIAAYDDLRQAGDPQHALLQRLHDFLELPPPHPRERLPWRNRQRGTTTGARAAAMAMPMNQQLHRPSCAQQQQLALGYQSANQELYDWLEAHPGPGVEPSRPFPAFAFQCREQQQG